MRYAYILLFASFPFSLFASLSFWSASFETMEAQEGRCSLFGKVKLETEGFSFQTEKMLYDISQQKIEAQDKLVLLLKQGGVLSAEKGVLFPDAHKGLLSGGKQVLYQDKFSQMFYSISSKKSLFFWNDGFLVDRILFLKDAAIDLTGYASLRAETVCVKKDKQQMRFFCLSGEPSSFCTLQKEGEAFLLAKSILYDALLHKVSCLDAAGSVSSVSFDAIKQKPLSFFSRKLIWKDLENQLLFPKGGVFSIPGFGKIESHGSCIAYLEGSLKKKEVQKICAKGKTHILDESLSQEKFRSLLFGGTATIDFTKGILTVDCETNADDKVLYQDQNLLSSANKLQVFYSRNEKGFTPKLLTLKGAVHIAVAKKREPLFSIFADSVRYHLATGELCIQSNPGGTILCVDPSSSYQIRAKKMTFIKTKKGFEMGKVEGDMRMRLNAAELEVMQKRFLQLQTLF